MGSNALAGRKTIARCLAAAVASVLAILLVPTGASATHLTATGSGGATVPWGFNEDWRILERRLQRSRHRKQPHAVGGRDHAGLALANRFHVQWAFVEENPGTYDWTISDAVYAAMQEHTVKPVMPAPQSAQVGAGAGRNLSVRGGGGMRLSAGSQFDDEWKSFVQAAVARYPNVRAIEVWNEPNLGIFWAPAPDPDRYAAVLKAAHDGVLAAGGSAPSWWEACPGGHAVPTTSTPVSS